MTGRMVSKWPGQCLECTHIWKAGDMIFYNEGRAGYYCSEGCARGVVVLVDAQMTPQVTNVPPTANIAVNAKETPQDAFWGAFKEARQMAIAEAHMENMAANADLCLAIDLLTAVCDDLRAELAKIAKCMLDERLERHGVKV